MFFKGKVISGIDALASFLEIKFPSTVLDFYICHDLPIFKSQGIWHGRKRGLRAWRKNHPEAVEDLEDGLTRERNAIQPQSIKKTRWEK